MMMDKNMATLFKSMIVLALLSSTSNASQINEISCLQSTQLLVPCLHDAQGSGTPSDDCCSAISTINQRATTTPNRREICECFKQITNALPINWDKLKEVPKLCGIGLPFPFVPNFDCNRVV
ncbi:PREDICTED: non-specific lipid-transfer protein 1-like [Lupinus angustifolius]|uniref:non-specific lipid-transfer protein 1-like n=1 Tax=Lupinus angustifolius TaxID=3871 RepID=UPI00092F721B|nr:PREDICTED: non-specific lipid-transfer protein 1-like [Lupinus angustifolius]